MDKQLPANVFSTMTMTTTTVHDRTELTPPQPSRQSNTLSIFNRPGSPLKQEVLASPVFGSPDPAADESLIFTRDSIALDQTQRWTVLAREAEADEISLLSITSEEKGYYASILPDDTTEPIPVETRRISGFDENAFVECDNNSELRKIREGSVERYSEIEDYEPLPTQFHSPTSPPTRFDPPNFAQAPPSDPPPYVSLFPFFLMPSENKKYVFYPLPIPKQLMLPPRLTGPNATKLPPPTARPPPKTSHATDALNIFLDSHMIALQDDPEIVLQTEFDSNSLMGTLMNNLRDQKQEIKGRAITNEQYVPGGKSLLEIDQEKVQRMHMGKALSSKGGRNWSSGTSRSGGSPQRSQIHDEVFKSVSLAEMEQHEEDEEVPLSVLRERIVTQRHDAEESLVDRIKRLKEEKRRRKVEETETLVERMARLKMEQNETLQERKNRLRRQNGGMY